jgi:diguanylate cyclase (GGDEF)-like protein
VIDAQITLAELRAELLATKDQEKRSRYLAMHDGVTSLPNQRFLRAELDNAITKCEPLAGSLALLYLDLDGFKAVNDTYGHDVGDQLLRIVAARLRGAVRGDDLVGRVGGDEFACIVTGSPGRDQLRQIACNVFEKIASPQKLEGLQISVRLSIGISIFPHDGANADALFRNADCAMYRSKRERPAYAFFDEGAGGGNTHSGRRSDYSVLQ